MENTIMSRFLGIATIAMLALVPCAMKGSPAQAADLEAFEFNDFDFTTLQDAANTGSNPVVPFNQWVGDGDLTDSTVQSGVFDIRKANNNFAEQFLQIEDINPGTTGSRYIVVEMAGWDIRAANASNQPEQIRFGFLDDDTVTPGDNAITAQVQISSRDLGSGATLQLEGSALGTGATNLGSAVELNTVQTAPFIMVLELDKTNNKYEVFYKDGTNPSQSLAQGNVSPDRDGNSIRFVANWNFGSSSLDGNGDPVPDLDEFFAIERIAVTDTNPLSDVLTVEIDRVSGEIKLINTSGVALSGLESYTISSEIGALDATGWKTITDNYDNAGPGDGSVDMDDDWMVDTTTTYELTESVISGDGGDLAINQEVILSTGDGPWIKNPVEDLAIELMFAGGVVRRPSVHFVGNGGSSFDVADLNFDGSITADDWAIFIAGAEADLGALSPAEAYQMGDLNYGGLNGVVDFDIFKAAFEAANPSLSFAEMIAGISVPEPSSLVLLMIGCMTTRRRRN